TRKLEVRQTENAVTARAAVRESRAEADEESPDKHPRELASVTEANHLIEDSKIPDRRPAAAKHRRQESADCEAGDERQPPSSRQAHRVTREVADRQHEAADIFEAGGDAEATVREEEQCERDEGDGGPGNRPVYRRQLMEYQRHRQIPNPKSQNPNPKVSGPTRLTVGIWNLGFGFWDLLMRLGVLNAESFQRGFLHP